MDKAELKKYLAGIAKERGFDETRTGRLLGIVEGEGDVTLSRDEIAELLAPIVEHPFSRQSAFSKAMDEGNARIKKYDEWYPQASAAANAALEKAGKSEAALAKYEKLYGPVDDIEDVGDGKGRTPSGAIVDLKKVEEVTDQKLQAWGRDTMRVVLDSNKVTREHARRFKGEIVDLDPLMTKVAEHQVKGERDYDLIAAYQDEYGDKIKELDTAAQLARDNGIAEKARLEERTRLMAGSRPGAVVRDEKGVFWDKQAADEKVAGAALSTDERQSAFLSDLNTELAKRDQEVA